MSRFLFILFCCFSVPALAYSQEQDMPQEAADAVVGQTASDDVPESDTETEEDAADEEENTEDDSDLDLQTYEENDDIFVPTEEIPTDEPIPFPSDI